MVREHRFDFYLGNSPSDCWFISWWDSDQEAVRGINSRSSRGGEAQIYGIHKAEVGGSLYCMSSGTACFPPWGMVSSTVVTSANLI